MSVYQILKAVAEDPSKNNKIAILSKHKDNAILQNAIRLCYSPDINFYIKKIPSYPLNTTKTGISLADALDQLTQLSSRKVTGNAGIEFLSNLLSQLHAEDADVLARVVARDLRSGFSDSTANKVWKNLIPDFPYMRCSGLKGTKLDQLSWKEGVYSQEKADGLFLSCNHTLDGDVQLLTRSGTVFPLDQFEYLVLDVQHTFPKGTQSHGELLVKKDGKILPRQLGNGILNSVAKGGTFAKNEQPVYMVWDQVALNAVVPKGSYNVPYRVRYDNLVAQVVGSNFLMMIPTKVVHSYEDAIVHYREMLAGGFEGTIIKDANAIWEDRTSKKQIKLKLETTVDLVIVGFNEGNGKNEGTFGSIVCRSSDNMLEVSVSGFSDADRVSIWAEAGKTIGKIMAVKSNCIMPPSGINRTYSLFLPRCEEIREDKHVADSLQRIINQFDSAIK